MSAVDRAPRRAHGAAGAELGDEPPRQAAGKRSRSEEAAEEDAPSTELEAEEAGDRGTEEPGTSEHAGDWDLSFELLSALGLQSVEGDPEKGDKAENEATNEATNEAKHDRGLEPGRRKATAAAWANREEPAGDDTAIARAGFTGSAASSFPHREAIERSFGAPLPATAFLGGAAAEASAALGAEGYALGDQVGFASTAPSLELAAHEAAHVMQATSGVQRHGGEGVYEDHADAVAARVVRGESAADLLAAGPVAAPAVRRGKQSRRQRRLRQILQAQREQERQRQAQQARRRKVRSLRSSLVRLIRRAEWKEIRKDAYPAESRDGIERAKQLLERGHPQRGHAEQPRRQRTLQYLAARGASRRAIVSGCPLRGWPCPEDERRSDLR